MKHFIKRLKRALKWFKRGWHTQEWDYAYLLDMWRFKLDDMRDFWNDPRNIHISEKSRLRNHKQLSICAFLLKRLSENQYEEIHIHKPMESKWGELQIIDKETLKNGSVVTEIKREKVNTPTQSQLEKKELDRRIQKADKIQEYDIELFCKIFSKHHSKWWD